jgi:hypothetical protein
MTNQKKKIQHKQQIKKTIEKKYLWVAGIILVVIIMLFVFPGILKEEKSNEVYYMFQKEGELTVSDSLNNQKVKIDIEIADTDYERQLGLMKRVSMEQNQGMLFLFPDEAQQSFWMRNTLISLDMIFINSEKEIVTIHKRTKMLSEQSYPSTAPARYVLEVISGFTDKYDIQVGSKIGWIRTK